MTAGRVGHTTICSLISNAYELFYKMTCLDMHFGVAVLSQQTLRRLYSSHKSSVSHLSKTSMDDLQALVFDIKKRYTKFLPLVVKKFKGHIFTRHVVITFGQNNDRRRIRHAYLFIVRGLNGKVWGVKWLQLWVVWKRGASADCGVAGAPVSGAGDRVRRDGDDTNYIQHLNGNDVRNAWQPICLLPYPSEAVVRMQHNNIIIQICGPLSSQLSSKIFTLCVR